MGLTVTIRNDGPRYRVSRFSAWQYPRHTLHEGKHETQDAIWDAVDSQFCVVVTLVEDLEPESFRRAFDDRTPVAFKRYRW